MINTEVCICCNRAFTYIAVEPEKPRIYCSICDRPSKDGCIAGIHCNVHNNAKDDQGCSCDDTAVGDVLIGV